MQAFRVPWAVQVLDAISRVAMNINIETNFKGGHTRALHWTPLTLTASITASTFFSRDRAFAFRVGDNFHGVFL